MGGEGEGGTARCGMHKEAGGGCEGGGRERQREETTGSSIGGISTQEHGRFSEVRANDSVGNWTWVVSPTTLNEVRAAWSTSVPHGGCHFATANPIDTQGPPTR